MPVTSLLISSKFSKVWQYFSVVIAEYKLLQYLKSLGVKLTQDTVDDFTDRFKKMGSSISTVRMVSLSVYLQDVENVHDIWRHPINLGYP